MSKNNNPPAGSNNNNNNNRKRKPAARLAIPTADENSGQKKRRTEPQPGNSPAAGPPAQPGFGFGNPTNPSAYAPMPTLYAGSPPGFPPFATTGTAFAPQYPHSQAQPHWPQQQQPQYVPQPGGYYPGYQMQPMFTPSNMGFAAGQQQVTPQAPVSPQHADSSSNQAQKTPVELFKPDNIVVDNTRDECVPKIKLEPQANETDIVFETNSPKTTVSKAHGERGFNVVNAQYRYAQGMHDGGSDVYTAMTSRPLMSRGPKRQLIQPSQSDQPLVSTKKGGRRQRPGTAPAQAPAQALAQAADQGQGHAACPNCGRQGHVVGDCVGPPNPIHGDLPACPVCNTFAGRANNSNGSRGHRFDDCPKVEVVLHSHNWDKNRRLAFEDLASLTDSQLCLFFDALVTKRLRKTPIRTQLVCWIDVLREVARRGPGSEALRSLENMTPWTKDFAKQQRDSAAPLVKPWDVFNYAAGNTLRLPACPVAQIGTIWDNLVADGFPHFSPQVFNSNDRQRPSENTNIAAEASSWKGTVEPLFQYFSSLCPISSGRYDPGFEGVDDERLMRPLTYFLCRKEKRDRFTEFLEAGSKPDSWYCVDEICCFGPAGVEPVNGRCLLHYENGDCPLQVRHLDASSGGRTLDFRVQIATEDEED